MAEFANLLNDTGDNSGTVTDQLVANAKDGVGYRLDGLILSSDGLATFQVFHSEPDGSNPIALTPKFYVDGYQSVDYRPFKLVTPKRRRITVSSTGTISYQLLGENSNS